MRLGLGIDTGGTYTDSVILDLDTKEIISRSKALTTHDDLLKGIVDSIDGLRSHENIQLVSLSSTLATNSVVEGKGCRVGLLTIGKRIVPDLDVSSIGFVDGEFDMRGNIVTELDEMSATNLLPPIPRTLAMSYLADMDVSVIDELPPGRTPIQTKLVSLARVDDVARVLLTNKAQHLQAYWVCPLIEEGENSALSAVSMRAAWLRANYPDLKVGLLHGALSADDKQRVMHAFETGDLDVLVSTTVVEVGVDVPGANLMIIEQAERFGLAQLHQLRGRVGRGSIPGHCILLFSQSISQNGKERLAVIRNTTDGFAIAREDLRLRGPGEFLGARQSGTPLLKYADPTLDASLLQAARDAATEWIAAAPEQAREHARRWYAGREGFLEA